MKMEQTECSETSAYKIQTPGNHPKESIQHSGHGESLKSRTLRLSTNNAVKARKLNGDMLHILDPKTKCICPLANSRLREGLYDTDWTGLCVPPAGSD